VVNHNDTWCYACSDSVVNLKFEEEPNYARYISMFEPIVNTPERPLQIDTSLQAIVSVCV